MIKISNLNFQNQTIETIEVNGETVDNLEIKLTKTKFNIVIVKDGKSIKKEIKKKDAIVDLVIEDTMENIKEEVEEVVEDIKEVVEENIKEVVVEDIKEEVVKPVTLAKMKDLLKAHIPKKNTLDSYCRTMEQVYGYFKVEDIHELLSTKEKDIIHYLEEKYESISTIKSKLCAMYKVYKLLNIENELFKNKIEHYAYEQKINQDKHKELNKKTTQEGNSIIEYFKNKLAELETVQEDNWTQQSQLYCILKIYLTYGVMRPSEILDCSVTESDCEGNHINISTKQIVIHHHKNDRKGKKVIQIDDELVECLRKGLGRYLVTNQSDKLYQSSSAFTKAFKTYFNDYTPYCLRKAISSAYIAEGDIEKIKTLEHNQGHSLQVILNNYNVYTKAS
jgi:regulator of replication initiation timing